MELWFQKGESALRERIHKELLLLGFKPHTQGMRDTEEALFLLLTGQAAEEDLKHGLYISVARYRNTTPEAVERNIRYSIETVWTKGNLPELEKRFGYTVQAEKGKPTNRAFLAQMKEHLNRHDAA